MLKKIISCALAVLTLCTAVTFAQAVPKEANDESEMWYEFKQKVLTKNYKFYAFKTDAQLKNRGKSVLNRSGWGVGPQESVEQFFATRRFEKTVIFDELKATMKEEGYKYAFTVYKAIMKETGTTIHLYTFWYDADSDTIYVQRWSK